MYPSELSLWNTIDDRVLWTRPALSGTVRPLAFTGDGKYLVMRPAQEDGDAKSNALVVLDAATGMKVNLVAEQLGLESLNKIVKDVAASPDGKQIALTAFWITHPGPTGMRWGVEIFSTATWGVIAKYEFNEIADFFASKFTPDSKNLIVAYRKLNSVDKVTGNVDQSLRIGIIASLSAEPVRFLTGPVAFPSGLDLSQDARFAAISSLGATMGSTKPGEVNPSLFVYDLQSKMLVRTYPAYRRKCYQ